MWEVEFTDEFEKWWTLLNEKEQKAVAFSVRLLEQEGPSLSFPYSSSIRGSKYGNMRELRSQCEGKPLRTFYAFDIARAALLLIGGDKTGNGRFYDEFIPVADRIYEQHLKEIECEE
jgi:hypothetical protein